ncbi:MAG: hypothetical protein HY301_18540, partial [Verrucomicrobia bacterium]|nr:hypothetical protein [Verrucomicrobiota bacterium]
MSPSEQPSPSSLPARVAAGGIGLADLCIKRPVFATMMNVLLVVLGLVS